MPVHAGHLALIAFATERCDELIVSLSHQPDEPIPGRLRFEWLKELFADHPKIRCEISVHDFDDESLPLNERTQVWAQFLTQRFPKVDIIFSSETYGPPLAEHLGAMHMEFDLKRTQVPVSASQIRSAPFRNWEYIPTVVRPFFVKKICFYGPESTGKSTMARKMAAHFNTEFVPEVAREMITSNEFTTDDIVKIGYAQTERVIQKSKSANKLLFCDSDLITTQIYSHYYLHEIPPVLFELEKRVSYDEYVFFDIDVPWVNDGLRDLGSKREVMRKIFERELHQRKIPFTLIQGDWETRFLLVKGIAEKLLKE